MIARAANLPVWFRFVAAAALIAGIFFRFYHLDTKTYWEDELFGTIHMMGYTESDIVARSATLTDGDSLQAYFRLPRGDASQPDSLANTVRALAAEDSQHPPLYYVAGHLWAEIFGTSAGTIRAFSAAVSLFAIPAMFWLCMELFASRTIAWTGTALFALSPFHLLYAQEAREYAMWTVVLLVMSAAFLRACRKGDVATWVLYGACVAIGSYVYPLTLLVALCFGVYLLCTPAVRTRRTLVAYAGASIAGTLAFVPWLRFIVAALLRTHGVLRGMDNIMRGRHSLSAIAATFVRNVRGVFIDFGRFSIAHVPSSAINIVPTLVIGLLVLAAFVFLWRKDDVRAARFIVLGLALPALPLLVHDVILGGILVDQPRYFISTFIAAELAIAAFLAVKTFEGGKNRRVWAAVTLALLIGEGGSCLASSRADTWWNKDYEVSREIANVVNDAPHPVVVSEFDTSRALGLAYYLAPSIALRLNLHCDLCFVDPYRPERSAKLLDDVGAYDTVFLLGSPDAVAPARASHTAQYRHIDVSIYSRTAHPLGMFLPI